MPQKWGIWVVLLVFLALLARGAVFYFGAVQDETRSLAADSIHYTTLARSLATHATFGLPFETGIVHQANERLREHSDTRLKRENGLIPNLFRTPGYPVFLVLLGLSVVKQMGLI